MCSTPRFRAKACAASHSPVASAADVEAFGKIPYAERIVAASTYDAIKLGASVNPNAPMASLPAVIFQFALSPYKDWQQLAWTGALLITLAVLTLSIIARILAAPRKSS